MSLVKLFSSPWLSGSIVGLMATSSKRAYATLYDPGVLQPEPLSPQQATVDPCLHRRHSTTQRQVWLSLSGVSGFWCTKGFVWALQASLVGMRLDSKGDFTPPTILLGLLLCPWTWDIFFWVGSNILLLMVAQKRALLLTFSQEKMSSTHPSTLPYCQSG